MILFTTSTCTSFPHCAFVSVTVLGILHANPAKMSKKQMSLESFFAKGKRPNDETAEDSKTGNKRKAALKVNTKSPI